MAQPKDWLYTLTDDQGRSYYVQNGSVQSPVAIPKPLTYTPDGWQDKSIKYARNTTNFGMWRTFTTPLKYVKDAALIVRDQLYRFGFERKLYQVIHRLDKKFGGGWVHKFFYRGELDLSQVDDTDTSVQVNIMEGDLIKLFKSNENTIYEIDIDVPDAVKVKMDGTFMQASAKYVIQKGNVGGLHLPGWLFINSEGTNFAAQTQTVYLKAGSITTSTSDKWILRNISEEAITFNLKGFIRVRASATGIYIFGFETSGGTQVPVYVNNSFPGGVDTDILFDVNITLQPDEKLFSIASWSNTLFLLSYLEEGEMNISFKSRYKTTYIKALRPSYVAQKLLDKITGGGYSFNSTYLTTEWENLLITSGDGIRAYNSQGNLNAGYAAPKLKISWAEFYEAYNVPCNLTAFIRNQILNVEKKEAVFQPTIQQAMGEVTDLVVSTAKDFLYNVVKVGYPNTDTEDVNGKDEFNVTVTYTSPITRVNKTLDLVSKVIASMYEIEITRINLDGKITTDDSNDNRNFFIHVEKTPTTGIDGEPPIYYKLLRNTYTNIIGLISPLTAFNLELHPELCLKRHGNFLRGVFYWQEGKDLAYQTSDKNGNVVVMNGTQTYIGNKKLRIGLLAPAPLFIPLTLKYKSPMDDDFIETMDAGPDGTFSIQYDGATLYGFPWDVGIQPANKPAQESTLLCSPQTDLNNLITISR